MSIPNSSEAVATTAGSSPALRASSVMSPAILGSGCRGGRTSWGFSRRQHALGVRGPPSSLSAISFQVGRQPFGDATVVGEDDRRAMRLDQIVNAGLDGGPHRALLGQDRAAGEADFEVEVLATARIDDRSTGRGSNRLEPSAERPLSSDHRGSAPLPSSGRAGWPTARHGQSRRD